MNDSPPDPAPWAVDHKYCEIRDPGGAEVLAADFGPDWDDARLLRTHRALALAGLAPEAVAACRAGLGAVDVMDFEALVRAIGSMKAVVARADAAARWEFPPSDLPDLPGGA